MSEEEHMEATYDVLSPWAETDPLPLAGINQRVDELRGKRVGLYANYKRAAAPIQDAVEAELRARYGSQVTITRFAQQGSQDIGSSDDEGPRFVEWLEKEVDTVIVAVGD
jgi:hypothetical protein